MKLVIYPDVDAERLAAVKKSADGMRVVNCADEEQAAAEIADAEAFFGKMTPRLLESARKLEWVQSPTASLEHYIFPALAEHPCRLSNMRGLFSDVIADQVLGYMICFSRQLLTYIRRQQEARWDPVGGEGGRPSFKVGPAQVSSIDRAHRCLSDLTLGVIGLGHIGAEVARRGAACGMRVIAVDVKPKQPPPGVGVVLPFEELDALLGEADFVVICAPHTPATEGLFRREKFERMKRDAVLINIGRGVIVNLTDLNAALEEGRIAGAALDVFEVEPLPADNPLWLRDNVIITPHVAGFSPRIAERHLAVLLDNIERFRKGEPLRNLVDKRQWF